MDVVRRRGELAALDRVERIGEPLLCFGQDLIPLRARGKDRHDPFRAFERKVRCFAETPLPPAIVGQALFGTDAIDRQLESSAAEMPVSCSNRTARLRASAALTGRCV